MKDVKIHGMGSFSLMGQLPDMPFVINDPKDEIRHVAETERTCRICGCTWNNACVTDGEACYWVEADLCSACATRSSLRGRLLLSKDDCTHSKKRKAGIHERYG